MLACRHLSYYSSSACFDACISLVLPANKTAFRAFAAEEAACSESDILVWLLVLMLQKKRRALSLICS